MPAGNRSPSPAASPARGWPDSLLPWLRHPLLAARAATARHQSLRFLQIIPVAVVLWGLDDFDRFRAGAAAVGLKNALAVAAISSQLGGDFARQMNDWLLGHPVLGTAAAWYYVLLQGAIAGFVGLLLIWRRVPSFKLHRNALIACNLIGLVVFWLYPVAPPRMLPGYHDITGSAIPFFSSILEGKAADLFASLPSLHVTWALWVAVAAAALLEGHPVLRVAVWLYPVATVLDVLATANHYWLDVITAPGVLALAYAMALLPAAGRRFGLLPRHRPTGSARLRWSPRLAGTARLSWSPSLARPAWLPRAAWLADLAWPPREAWLASLAWPAGRASPGTARATGRPVAATAGGATATAGRAAAPGGEAPGSSWRAAAAAGQVTGTVARAIARANRAMVILRRPTAPAARTECCKSRSDGP
ncbi:MAG TPA: phosphatase PAP2 family protein [Streptosporangiaceae bacterium]|nr:phosphatase PAP2 family protein [Streptosporangiaceae bacterium]